MENKKLAIALPKEACHLCGNMTDGPILIKKRFVNESNNEFEDSFNGKCIGYSDKPCEECQEIMDQAFLFIGFVEEKSDDMKNPYRSGNKWGINKEKALEMFGDDFCKKGAAYIDVKEAQKMGLPDANLTA